jgi:PAS domain S-box-containing protein
MRYSIGNFGFHLMSGRSGQGDKVARLPAPVRAPDISELETLVVCAAEGTLVAAAARLGISRPAVAKRIRNLEVLAGQRLLDRDGRGVRLTDAGATLLSASRRILAERDALLSQLSEIRGAGPSPIGGLRELLGSTAEASRAAQQPEARLAETERVLELVLRASTTGVVISDPDTSQVHAVNDSFCDFTGRSRAEQLGAPTVERRAWCEPGARTRMIDELRERGVAEQAVLRVRHPDGTVRVGRVTSRYITLAGTRLVLTTVDDVTEQDLLEVERTAGVGAYRAVAQVSRLLLEGRSAVDSIASVIPEVRRTGSLATVLLWDLRRGCLHTVAGEQPPGDLDQELLRGEPLRGGAVLRIGDPQHPADGATGWAAELGPVDHSLILLNREPLPETIQVRYIEMLTDLAALAAAGHGPTA